MKPVGRFRTSDDVVVSPLVRPNFGFTPVALWIAWKELRRGPRSFALAVLATAVAVAICVVTELTYRAREVAVSVQIDAMGPALVMLPAGNTSRDLARFELGENDLPASLAQDVKRELSAWIRAAEGRLLLRCEVDGNPTPLVGVAPADAVTPFDDLRRLREGRAVLGLELAERLHKGVGDRVTLGHLRFLVAAVLPRMASPEDVSMFVSLSELQKHVGRAGRINEVRLFPYPGKARDIIVKQLRSRTTGAAVIALDNDDGTRRDVHRSLREHRGIVYVLTAAVSAFCLFLWSNLNAGERRLELATLVAIGGPRWMVFNLLASRAALVALVGALLGSAAAIGLVLVRDPVASRGLQSAWQFLVLTVVGSVFLGVAGAFPASLASAHRDHARVLQG